MPTGNLLGLITFLGILVQEAATLLLAGLFLVLDQRAGRREYFRQWARAWGVLSLAILALIARYFIEPSAAPGSDDGSAAVRTLYAIYQLGKFAFAAFLVSGVWQYARGQPGGRAFKWSLGALAVYGVATAYLLPDLERVVLLQAPILVAALLLACAGLRRILPEQRTFGSRFLSGVLAAMALLWVAYAFSFARAPRGEWPAVVTPFTLLMAFNSYVDLLFQILLGYGMVVVLMQDIQREADEARAQTVVLQARLAQAEKLRAVGGLVSGVAHELNNPLTAILGFAEELRDKSLRTPSAAHAVRVIHEQAQRCQAIVKNLLLFTGDRTERRVAIRLCERVERVVRGFQPDLLRRGVLIECALDPAVPELTGDAAGLEQVIANLVSNAADAAGRGGRISVQVRSHGGYAELAVEDDGPGIPPQILRRLFEPFFTTKEPGRGTGLGLCMAHGIVEAHGGTIQAANRPAPERGARFTVRLPCHAVDIALTRSASETSVHEPMAALPIPRHPQEGSSEPARAPRPPDTAPGTQPALPAPVAGAPRALRVLLIDDEEVVRDVLRSFCERKGWSVEEAADGASALRTLEAITPERTFDVVLSDLKMPGLSGAQLHDRMLGAHPELLQRMVFITGDVASPEAAAFASRTRCPLLQKPFDFKTLAALMERTASEAGRAPAGRMPERIDGAGRGSGGVATESAGPA
jgi:signal transduction histidine kinase/CheY-like chemotaxis protein